MTKHYTMGHWYKCEKCGKNIPIRESFFLTQDDEKVDILQYFCPFCNTIQFFQFSDDNKPCTKEEALLYFKIDLQKRDGIIRFETEWKRENNDQKKDMGVASQLNTSNNV